MHLSLADGIEIEWRVEGQEGPLVAIASMSLQPPIAFRNLVENLAEDHRVLTYDLRGLGRSSRSGPYDLETDADDLAAVVEEAGGDALVVALGDGARRAVRSGTARPELIHTVAISGEQPLGPLDQSRPHRSLADSPAVLAALLQLLETDYRSGLRTMFESGDEGWDETALRERLDAIEAHCPRDAGVARLRAWILDDSREQARAMGDRLWFLHFPGNAWFRGSLETIRPEVPEAHFEPVPEGVLTCHEENAVVIRRILARRRAAA